MFRPLLSGKAPDDLTKIAYPVLASPKIDGIRVLITDNGPVTRKLEPIPNPYIRSLLSKLPVGFDGEITVGPVADEKVWNRTQSAVMKESGEPDFVFHVFDDFSLPNLSYLKRMHRARERFLRVPYPWCVLLPQTDIADADELRAYEDRVVSEGFEGAMIREPYSPYKHGRSTTKEGILLKLKRWHDAEATVVGAKERLHNANELEVDALGYAKRATKKEGKVGRGDLGALVCVMKGGSEFDLGSGFTDEQRASLWKEHLNWDEAQQSGLHGLLVKFKYQGMTPDHKPRFPIFLGFRDRRDT